MAKFTTESEKIASWKFFKKSSLKLRINSDLSEIFSFIKASIVIVLSITLHFRRLPRVIKSLWVVKAYWNSTNTWTILSLPYLKICSLCWGADTGHWNSYQPTTCTRSVSAILDIHGDHSLPISTGLSTAQLAQCKRQHLTALMLALSSSWKPCYMMMRHVGHYCEVKVSIGLEPCER